MRCPRRKEIINKRKQEKENATSCIGAVKKEHNVRIRHSTKSAFTRYPHHNIHVHGPSLLSQPSHTRILWKRAQQNTKRQQLTNNQNNRLAPSNLIIRKLKECSSTNLEGKRQTKKKTSERTTGRNRDSTIWNSRGRKHRGGRRNGNCRGTRGRNRTHTRN